MQVQIQMVRIEMNLSLELCRQVASTKPFPRRQKTTLRNNKKKPQFHLSDGTIWHGPTFKNLAIPTDAEKTEIENVIQNIVFPSRPRKFFSTPPVRVLFLKYIIRRMKTVGTASINGSGKNVHKSF